MASGKLGSAALTADTDTSVYTVPSVTLATISIAIVNRGTDPSTINVAIATSGTPANADYIEFQTSIPPNGVLERTGIVCTAAEQVVIRSSTANCTVRVHGFEEAV